MSLQLVTAPTVAAVTTAEAKLHLRVTSSAEDALIDALVAAATQEAEHLMQRAVMPQQWQLTLDAFPPAPVRSAPRVLEADARAIALLRPPVSAITSVQYVDAETGTLATLDPSAYQLAASSDYVARLLPAFGTAWPATRCQAEAVQVVFACGYADADSVPELIKAWIKLHVAALYENRQAWTQGRAIERNPFVDRLLDRYCLVTL